MTEIILVMNGHVTKKLLEVDVRSNKWHETYQNIHFSSFRQLIWLAVGRWFIFFFAHGARVGRQKKIFRSEAEKKTFSHRFWWIGRETRNKTIFFFFLGHRIALPCYGYSLESHWRCVLKEYPQCVLWKNKQNYPLIITKYPLYMFHSCVPRPSENSYQPGHPPSLIRVFAVRSLSS